MGSRVLLLACALSCSAEPAAPAPAAATPVAPALPRPPAPVAPVTTAPPPPAPPASGCVVSPAGGVLVAARRGRARISVGRTGALVAHSMRGRAEAPSCERMDGLAALRFPLGGSPAVHTIAVDPGDTCHAEDPDPIVLTRVADEAMAVSCSYAGGGGTFGCSALAPFSAAAPRLSFELRAGSWEASSDVAIASTGGTLFGAVVAEGVRLVGFVVPAGGETVKGSLGPVSLPAPHTILVEPASATSAMVRVWGPRGQGLQWAMNAAAAPVGEPTRVAPPVPTGLRIEVQREGREPPHLVGVVPGSAATAPLAGIDPGAATFAPSFAGDARGWTIVWSEGLGDSTRIRAARLDPAGPAVRGPIVEVSTAGREAGVARLDTFGGRVVVVWDEKGEGWEVRAAELRCGP